MLIISKRLCVRTYTHFVIKNFYVTPERCRLANLHYSILYLTEFSIKTKLKALGRSY